MHLVQPPPPSAGSGAEHDAALDDAAPRVCPRCGHASPADAVFCEVPACHKALGELPFANERLAERERWHTALADRVTAFIAHPSYIAVHVVWFAAWIAVNTGVVMGWRRF